MIVNNLNSFWVLFFSFTLTLFSIWSILHFKLLTKIIDIPNKRSLHKISKPRTGGMVFMPIILLMWLLSGIHSLEYILISIVGFMTISFLDDVRNISAGVRFIFHIIFTSFFVLSLDINLNLFYFMLVILSLVWMSNLFNFMDGSDGIAAGMAVIGFLSYSITAYIAGDEGFALMNGIIVMCTLSFLLFNFAPSKIFMGDVGSISLGFLSGAMGIIGWQKELWALWFPLLIFSPFIVDTTTTLLKRFSKKEKFWKAHREHYYQRLILLGWSHRKTALISYLVMIYVSLISIYINYFNDYKPILIIIFLGYFLVMIYIDIIWKNYLLNKKGNNK